MNGQGHAGGRRHLHFFAGVGVPAGFGGGGGGAAMAAFMMPHHQPPPPPLAEPPGLPDGGLVDIPCTAVKIDMGSGIGAGGGGIGRGGGGRIVGGGQEGQAELLNEYEKYVIHQSTEPYSMCAPSEDVLLWATRSGQEIIVVNTRLQIMTKHHLLRTSPQTVGIVLSSKCVMFTNESGFVLVISPIDKSFRLIYDQELRITINGQPLGLNFGPVRATNRGRLMAGRATHVLKDNETIVHLLADPAVALFFRISDIKKCVQNKAASIEPFNTVDLSSLPSTAIGRTDPLESVIMMLENRILLGAPILERDRLEWAWLDTDKGIVRNEQVLNGPHGGPQLHPSYLMKVRVNPLNLYEIYVHIVNPYQDQNAGQRERRLPRGEMWVMGMSTKEKTFQWKRRERPPSQDDPNYKQIMQTPLDWTRTPEGILYVRWCDFEGIGPGDEYLCDYRMCRSFTLTRVENTVSSLSSMAARVLQDFDRLPFPLPRPSTVHQQMRNRTLGLNVQQLQPMQPTRGPVMTYPARHRAAVTGVTTASDFMRHVTALLIDNTTHVYYDGEQVYDDTEELIEQQRRAISQMTRRTPFRSIFGTLFSQATNMDNPAVNERRLRPPPIKKKSPRRKKEEERMDGGDGEMDEEEEEEEGDQPGPSDRMERRGRDDNGNDDERRRKERRGVQRMTGDGRLDYMDYLLALERERVDSSSDEDSHHQLVAAAPPLFDAAAADDANAQRAADVAAAAIIAEHLQQEEEPGMMAAGEESSEL